jgi:hypothetical protein
MARRISSRVVLNRKCLTAIREGEVAGLEAFGQAVLATAQPNVPDDIPYGEGLVTEGDYGVWSDGKKVAGGGGKPRGVRTKEGVTLVVGFPFPMRFYEKGTVHQPARPVLTPAMLGELGSVVGHMSRSVRSALAKLG